MKVVGGSSSIYLSTWTWWDLHYEKMEAIFHPDRNVLEVMSNSARNLDRILFSLRRYRASKGERYKEPIEVRFW